LSSAGALNSIVPSASDMKYYRWEVLAGSTTTDFIYLQQIGGYIIGNGVLAPGRKGTARRKECRAEQMPGGAHEQ
jgi:hypothetical protein